jgi:hypothetical protein
LSVNKTDNDQNIFISITILMNGIRDCTEDRPAVHCFWCIEAPKRPRQVFSQSPDHNSFVNQPSVQLPVMQALTSAILTKYQAPNFFDIPFQLISGRASGT